MTRRATFEAACADCIIRRFDNDPTGFSVDNRYSCDVPSQGSGNRLTESCGRTIAPEIAEDGTKTIIVDPFSRACAVALGTVVGMDQIDTSGSQYL